MRTKFYFFVGLIFGAIILFSQESTSKELLSNESVEQAMIAKCYICHNPRVKNYDDMIAPPMVDVKYMYKMRFPVKSQFIEAVVNFVLSPNDTKAVMKGRVMTHGVMPDLSFQETEVRAIAEYIFKTDIEVPNWFPEYFEKRHGVMWESQ